MCQSTIYLQSTAALRDEPKLDAAERHLTQTVIVPRLQMGICLFSMILFKPVGRPPEVFGFNCALMSQRRSAVRSRFWGYTRDAAIRPQISPPLSPIATHIRARVWM